MVERQAAQRGLRRAGEAIVGGREGRRDIAMVCMVWESSILKPRSGEWHVNLG